MKRASVAILAISAAFFAIACSVLTRNESPSVSGATEDQSPTQTVAATPVSTHRPISPASVTSTHILEDFPLGVGTTWVYSATFISGWWFGEDLDDAEFMEIRHTGLITETIVGKNHAGNTMVFTAALSGILTETVRPWGQITGTVISTMTEKYPGSPLGIKNRSYRVAGQSIYRDGLEILRKPLEVGQEWAPFGEKALEDVADGWYVWRVAKQADMVTSAGAFQDCLYLELWTAPDHSLNWFCPGVGFIYREYHHHGTPGDQYWELRSFHQP